MKLTKKVDKDIRRLVKLVSKERKLNKATYELVKTAERKLNIKDKEYNIPIYKRELTLSSKGLYKHLVEEVSSGRMGHSIILYMISVNEQNKLIKD